MKHSPPSLRRILLEAVVLVAAHFVLLQILSRVNLLEHLLAPGAGSRFALGITAVFLLLRGFLFVVAPGWLFVRLWLWATRPEAGDAGSAAGPLPTPLKVSEGPPRRSG